MLGRGFNPSSASVSIRHRTDAPIEALTPNIKMLVANSIEGLVYDNVTVVNFPAAAMAERDVTRDGRFGNFRSRIWGIQCCSQQFQKAD